MSTEKIIRESVHSIKPFKHIRIGDPFYFEKIEQKGDKPNRYTKLVCDTKTSCCKVGAVIIKEVEITDEMLPDPFININVDIFLAKDEEQLEIYKSGRWYGEDTQKRDYELGCDTARFEIEVDGRYDEVHTGADGYYGFVKEMKQYFGFMAGLTFDGDLFSFEEVENLMNYLFKFET